MNKSSHKSSNLERVITKFKSSQSIKSSISTVVWDSYDKAIFAFSQAFLILVKAFEFCLISIEVFLLNSPTQ